MKASISFSELSDYISRQYNQALTFAQVSQKTISITYSRKILIKTVHVDVDITFLEVSPEALELKYNGGFGVDTLISGLLTFFKGKFPELSSMIEPKEGHQLRVNLDQFEKTKVLSERFSALDVNIYENSIEIVAPLKY